MTTTTTWALEHEAQLRLGVFLGLFGLVLIAQRLRPLRALPGGWRRGATNIALVVVDTALLRVAFPLLAFDLALSLDDAGRGLLRSLPPAAAIVAGVVLLDVAIYWQHRILHIVPIFWRLHRVHHADIGFDVTTGVRFHPLEIVLSMLVKLGLIAVLGVPPLAVLIFELALSAGSLFTHANFSLPTRVDHALRWVFVTPDMHRIHHSVHKDETNSNFGFHLSVWDRLFGSYRAQPRDDQHEMAIGLEEYRDSREQTLWALLLNPFR